MQQNEQYRELLEELREATIKSIEAIVRDRKQVLLDNTPLTDLPTDMMNRVEQIEEPPRKSIKVLIIHHAFDPYSRSLEELTVEDLLFVLEQCEKL